MPRYRVRSHHWWVGTSKPSEASTVWEGTDPNEAGTDPYLGKNMGTSTSDFDVYHWWERWDLVAGWVECDEPRDRDRIDYREVFPDEPDDYEYEEEPRYEQQWVVCPGCKGVGASSGGTPNWRGFAVCPRCAGTQGWYEDVRIN